MHDVGDEPAEGISVTHFAGPTVTIGTRVIQRCGWCGFKLADSNDYPITKTPALYPPGRLVRCVAGMQILMDAARSIPDDSCEDLVE